MSVAAIIIAIVSIEAPVCYETTHQQRPACRVAEQLTWQVPVCPGIEAGTRHRTRTEAVDVRVDIPLRREMQQIVRIITVGIGVVTIVVTIDVLVRDIFSGRRDRRVPCLQCSSREECHISGISFEIVVT